MTHRSLLWCQTSTCTCSGQKCFHLCMCETGFCDNVSQFSFQMGHRRAWSFSSRYILITGVFFGAVAAEQSTQTEQTQSFRSESVGMRVTNPL